MVARGEQMREGREEGRKKKKKLNAVFPSITLFYRAHTVVVVYKVPLSRLVGFASDI